MARQNRAVLVVIASLLLAGAIAIDFTSVPEVESSIFYVVPVSFFSWFLGRRSGLMVSAACAAAAALIRHANAGPFHSRVAELNAIAWFAIYLFFVLMISELKGLYEQERSRSHTDALTGLLNRRAFLEDLEHEQDRARRFNRPITLAYIDIDWFKEVNDQYGHEAGDKILQIVGQVMKREVRKLDVAARLGGDEFALFFPETDSYAAPIAVEKLHRSLLEAMHEQNCPVTFSIGVVTFQPPPLRVEEMISAADAAMYSAKKTGRGKLVIYPAA